VVRLVLVAPACEGNDILPLLDWNKELFSPYQDQKFFDFLKVSKGGRDFTPSVRVPLVRKAMLLRGGVDDPRWFGPLTMAFTPGPSSRFNAT